MAMNLRHSSLPFHYKHTKDMLHNETQQFAMIAKKKQRYQRYYDSLLFWLTYYRFTESVRSSAKTASTKAFIFTGMASRR